MVQLLESWKVFPEICRYLTAFGKKYFNKDEAFAGFDCVEYADRAAAAVSKLEMCYLLKYASPKAGANSTAETWVIRPALVYQQTSFATRETSHILVRLSENMKTALRVALTGVNEEVQEFSRDWTKIHSLLLGQVDDSWRQMINSLDSEVNEVFHRLIASVVIPENLNMFDSPAAVAQDMKHVQRLTDNLRRVATMIELNMETIDSLTKQVEMLKKTTGRSKDGNLAPFLHTLQRIKQEHRFALKNSSSVLDRAISLSNQLRDSVASRNTVAIVELSSQSGQEAGVVKTLTVLALVSVPASFVADFLQMRYVMTDPDNAQTWRAAQDMQLYAALAIPLVALTMGFYIALEMRKARNREWIGLETRNHV